MSDAPERLWVHPTDDAYFVAMPHETDGAEYIRADIARADADLGAAEAIRRAAEAIDGANGHDEAAQRRCQEAIRVLAPAEALAEVQRLRARVTSLSEQVDTIAEQRDAALARVEKLQLQLDQKDALYDSAYQAGVKVGWNLGVSDDEAGFRAATSSTEHVAELKRIRALAPGDSLAEVQRLREERDQAVRGRNEWSDDFKALAAAVVGDTGLSAMTVAAQARTFRPRAEQAEAERDTALARVEKLRHQMTEASDPDFIWGAMDNVHDAETTLDDYAAAVSRAIRAALDEETK